MDFDIGVSSGGVGGLIDSQSDTKFYFFKFQHEIEKIVILNVTVTQCTSLLNSVSLQTV